MQDVKHTFKAHCVDCAIGVAVMTVANLKYPATKTSKRLGVGGMIATLRFVQRLSNLAPNR